jgi:nitric oxide reductase subunit B
VKPTAADTTTVVQLRMALICIVLAVLGGALAVLHYVPDVSMRMNALGLTMPKLRPLHTTFATLWIYGAAIAVIYHYLAHRDEGLSRGDLRRFWFHTVCWTVAGVSIFGTLLAGITTGREYLGFHPAFSAVLLAGWLAFAFNFFRRVRRGFWQQPVYVYFWATGIPFFVYTFVEGHAWLLPSVQEQPLRDLQLHWKSCGTLVGSFNFLVYGALIYAGERLTGNRTYAQSPTAFWLFGVGCLNSFTNYVHHTYHVPQNHAVKWVAFVVSMLEIIILMKVVIDIRAMFSARNRSPTYCAARGFFGSARCWTGAMLAVALVISVPNLNSLIHGTHVVTGHVMGTEIGIDTMVLFGAVTFLIGDLYRRCPTVMSQLDCRRIRGAMHVLNAAAASLVGWLTVSGTAHGLARYRGEPSPEWVAYRTVLFPLLGGLVGIALLVLVARWLRLLFGVEQRGTVPRTAPLAQPQPAGHYE